MAGFEKDVNQGYVQFVRSISLDSGVEKKTHLPSLIRVLVHFIRNTMKLTLIPFLYLYGILVILMIRFRFALTKTKQSSQFHQEALHYIREFVSQYPMHLYPIVAKSLEMAFIKQNFESISRHLQGGIVELAIGDGTFSSRIFSGKNKIIAFDLNPYSLIQTRRYLHIAKRVVADCLNPPIEFGGASFIMSNNFLHHVTNKRETLQHWSLIARYALLNENTNYWAEGWYKPYLFKSLGLRRAARKEAEQIASRSLQTLWRKAELGILVNQFYEIQREESFFHEKVFFLCSICSALLFCYGPPTPELQKKVMNGIFALLTKKITYYMAKALIEYDAILPRDRDVFICWALESRQLKEDFVRNGVALICPDCHEQLQGIQCRRCHRSFEEKEGMLFLLPKELAQEISFREEKADLLGEEHL
jgi:hypothetical protein